MKPCTCPKFEKCSSPICPLDPDFFKRRMRSEDSVCLYLSEAVKRDAGVIFRGRGLGELYAAVSRVIPQIVSRWARIGRALERARHSGSRVAKLGKKISCGATQSHC